MSDREPVEHCPICQAQRITTAAGPCWLCATPLPETKTPVKAKKPEDSGFLVFLGFIFTFIFMGLMAEEPGVAILAGIVLLPVFARSIVQSRKSIAAGYQPTFLDKLGMFFSSLGLVVLGGMAAFLAFFVTCSAVCFGLFGLSGSNMGRGGDWIFMASMVIGAGPALLLFGYLMWRFWPRAR